MRDVSSLLGKPQSCFQAGTGDVMIMSFFEKGRSVTAGVESCRGLVERCCLLCDAGSAVAPCGAVGRLQRAETTTAASSPLCHCSQRTKDTETVTHLAQLLVLRRRLNGMSAEQVANKIIKEEKKRKKKNSHHQRTRNQKLISISVWS